MNSRERMLRTIGLEAADHIPCCFMSFTAQRRRVNEDLYALVDAELAMGLDSMLFIPAAPREARRSHPDLRGLPVRFHPEVTEKEWSEQREDGTRLLHREYRTPAGTLCCSVHPSEDWPHGDYVPFVDDYQVPRSIKPLVTGAADLEALSFLLVAPTEEDRKSYRQESQRAREFAKDRGVLLAGGWGVGLDMADWLCGIQNVSVMSLEDPEFVTALLELIHHWNYSRMELVLSGQVDLFIRRAWYEGCDFVTPTYFKKSVLPLLKREVELAHRFGTKFGYICSSGTLPMFDAYREAGIDVLIGIDPVQGTYTDMPRMKQSIGGSMCLWGGVSGAVTVEMGSEAEVRQAVHDAMQQLGPTGFVLCPVDNITVDAPQTWQNLKVFIEEWQRRRNL